MIRPYQATDYDDLLQLFRWNTPDFFGVEEEPHFMEFLRSTPENFFVIEQAAITVGCAGYSYQSDTQIGQVSWFVFHPQYQGQGLGKRMLNFCLDRLRENKEMRKVIVRTSQLVEGFFARVGFQTTHTEKDYWAPGFDLYVMELSV